MSFLFKRSPKTPNDLVRILNEQLAKLDVSNGSEKKKAQDEVARHLLTIKSIINGEDVLSTDALYGSQQDHLAQLYTEFYSTDIIYNLIVCLPDIDFDSRKIVVLLFISFLTNKAGNRLITIDYLLNKHKIIVALMRGPEIPEISLNIGVMLREAIRYEPIAKCVLYDPLFWQYFIYVDSATFEISSDAFATLHDILSFHRKLVGAFFSISSNAEKFSLMINQLIQNGNYVIQRESIKLLSETMMVKLNYGLMTKYVSDVENLKIVMLLLGDKSKSIQTESFNIFKVFVANPRKEKAVIDILAKNRNKLLEFLENFNKGRTDEVFVAEKEYIVQQIQGLPKLVSPDRCGEFKEIGIAHKESYSSD